MERPGVAHIPTTLINNCITIQKKDFKFVEFCMKLVNPNGRLILGLYGTKEQSMSKIDILKRTLKIELDVLECPHGQHPHIAAWYTQPSDGS